MYGRAADARRQPSPSSRHGHGRPPDGPPSKPWSVSSAVSRFLGWSGDSQTEALPPLALSGPHALRDVERSDDGVHHQHGVAPGSTGSNASYLISNRDLGPNTYTYHELSSTDQFSLYLIYCTL